MAGKLVNCRVSPPTMKTTKSRTLRAVCLLCLLGLVTLAGCQGNTPSPPIAAVEPPVATPVNEPARVFASATASPTVSASPSTTLTLAPSATALPRPAPTATATAVSEPNILLELARAVPPARDDARLAQAFRGLQVDAWPTPRPPVTAPLATGTTETFTVLDVVNNRVGEIEAELRAVSDHAYFWFEIGPFGLEPDPQLLAEAATAFDGIYEDVTAIFGREASPGVDGDARLHILHASPQTVCGVAPDGQGNCGIAGFVSLADLQPAAINPQSNEREMFLMNGQFFGGDYYLGVLAHEFRHMIESNYGEADADWEKEGSAVLASELAGLPNNGVARANEFLAEPDQQLNSWSEDGVSSYYGQAYLFNHYLYRRLGPERYREFATSPLPGFVALDAIASAADLPFNGEALWLDWLAALAIHDHPRAEERYRFQLDALQTAGAVEIEASGDVIAGQVQQFAADYYLLPREPVRVNFRGEAAVPLLGGQPAGEGTFWYAQRANYSNPRLTREVDLRTVEQATLRYDVYNDIELGYDFAYVSVSQDGGATWTPLAAEQMQGLDPADDPSESALAPRFYTGRDQQWRSESIDLTPFAGERFLLRFEIVTDPILTYSGFAVDNVSIPEIDYVDDESGAGWTAEGFTLAPALLPQAWRLQLVQFGEQGPIVRQLPVSAEGHASFESPGMEDGERPILIVASAVPSTLVASGYRVQIGE